MRGGRTLVVALIAALLTVLAPTPAPAQDAGPEDAQPPAPDTLELTLDDALRLAREGNPAFLRAANQLALDGPESREAWANQILPSPSVTLLSTGYTGNLTRRARDNFGNPIEAPESDWSFFSSTSQSLGLQWRVQGWNLLHARREHEQASDERRLGLEAAEWTLHSDVRREFFDVLEQRELLALEERLLETRRTDHEAARRLFELAETSRVDVLRAEFEIEQQALEIQRRRRAYEQALLRLRTRMGVEDLPPVRPAEEPLPIFDPSALDAERLVAAALDVNPDLRRSRSTLEGTQLSLGRTRNTRWPELSMSYDVGRLSQAQEGRGLFDLDHDPSDVTSRFAVQLRFPFFDDFFGNRLREAEARVRVDDAHEDLRETELAVEREVRGQLIELRNAWESLRVARRSLEIAEEAVELGRQEYRLGGRDFQELQGDVEAEAGARRQVVEARHGFVDALVALEEAVGGPVAPAGPTGN